MARLWPHLQADLSCNKACAVWAVRSPANLLLQEPDGYFQPTAPNRCNPQLRVPEQRNTITQLLAAAALPDEPLVTIESSRKWLPLSFGDLGNTSESLLLFLTRRDLKVRYKQTLLGIAWVVMQPLLLTLIFTVFLGLLARLPSGGLPYALLAYTGLLPWNFFPAVLPRPPSA